MMTTGCRSNRTAGEDAKNKKTSFHDRASMARNWKDVFTPASGRDSSDRKLAATNPGQAAKADNTDAAERHAGGLG